MILQDLHLGSLAAESDDELFNYFVVTPIAETIVLRDIGLVLGRKGSGKTALFRQMEELLSRQKLDHVNVIRLNMDDYAWAAFSSFRDLGLSDEHAATVAWQLAIPLQIAVGVANANVAWTNQSAPHVNILRKFVSDNFSEAQPSLETTASLFGQFSSLQVGAFGVAFEANFETGTPAFQLVPALTNVISQHLVEPLTESAWLLILDQLDESWDGSQQKKDLLVGLQKGVKRVNDDFGWRSNSEVGARAMAFLRTDIHESLAFDDKDKHRDMIAHITWTHETLAEMLQDRIGEVSLESMFESATSQRKGRIAKGSINYLISRTFMRPRDLLQFLIKIQSDAPGEGQITKEVVEACEPAYSQDKVDDLRQEYRRGAPWVDLALDALRQGPNKFEDRGSLERRLAERIEPEDLRERGIDLPKLVEWMVDASILGAAPRTVRTQSIRFKSEGASVSLGGDSTAWVHPALFLGLSLSEPRAQREPEVATALGDVESGLTSEH